MTDFELQDLSNKYVKDTYEFERNNPLIAVGMLVKTYNHDDPLNPIYCGIGKIKKMVWDCYYHQYIVDIDWADGKTYTTFAGCCERHVGCSIRGVV